MSWFTRLVNVLKPQPGSVLTGVSEPEYLSEPEYDPIEEQEALEVFLPDAVPDEPLAEWELELLAEATAAKLGEHFPLSITVGSTWKRNPPKKEVVRVGRVWATVGADGDTDGKWTVRATPVRGGKVLVAEAQWFLDNFTKQ